MFSTASGTSFYALILEVTPHPNNAEHLFVAMKPVWGEASLQTESAQIVPVSALLQQQALQAPPHQTLVLNNTPFDLDLLGKVVFTKPDSPQLVTTLLEGLATLSTPVVIIDPVGLSLPIDALPYFRFGEDISLSMQDVGVSTCLSWISQLLPPAIQAEATQALFRLIPPTADFIPLAYFTDHPTLAQHPLAASILHQFYQFHRHGVWAAGPESALTTRQVEAGIHLDLSGLPGHMMPYAYEGLLRFIRQSRLQSTLQLVLVAPEVSIALTHALLQEDRHRIVLVSQNEAPWKDWVTDRLVATQAYGTNGIRVEGPMAHHLPVFLPFKETIEAPEPIASHHEVSEPMASGIATDYEETDAGHWVQYNPEVEELHWDLDAFQVSLPLTQPVLTWHPEASALEEAPPTAPIETWELETVATEDWEPTEPLEEDSEETLDEAPAATVTPFPLAGEPDVDEAENDLLLSGLADLTWEEPATAPPAEEPDMVVTMPTSAHTASLSVEPDWLNGELLFTLDQGPILDPSLPPVPEALLSESTALGETSPPEASETPQIDTAWLGQDVSLHFNGEPESPANDVDLDIEWFTSPEMDLEDSDETAYTRDMHADEDNPLPHLNLQEEDDDIAPPPFLSDDEEEDSTDINAGLLDDLLDMTPLMPLTVAEDAPKLDAPKVHRVEDLDLPEPSLPVADPLADLLDFTIEPPLDEPDALEPLPLASLEASPLMVLEPQTDATEDTVSALEAPAALDESDWDTALGDDDWPTMTLLDDEEEAPQDADTEEDSVIGEPDMWVTPQAPLLDPEPVPTNDKPAAAAFEADLLPLLAPLSFETPEDLDTLFGPTPILEEEAEEDMPFMPAPALGLTEDIEAPTPTAALESEPTLDAEPLVFQIEDDWQDLLSTTPETTPVTEAIAEAIVQPPPPPEPPTEPLPEALLEEPIAVDFSEWLTLEDTPVEAPLPEALPEPAAAELPPAPQHPDPLDFIFGEPEQDLGLNFQLDFEQAEPTHSVLAGPEEPTLPPPMPADLLTDDVPLSLMADLEGLEGDSLAPEKAEMGTLEVPVVKSPPPKAPPLFQPGEQVRHHRYGQGVIKRVITMNDEQVILNINFEGIGKRLLDPRLTPLEKVS